MMQIKDGNDGDIKPDQLGEVTVQPIVWAHWNRKPIHLEMILDLGSWSAGNKNQEIETCWQWNLLPVTPRRRLYHKNFIGKDQSQWQI